ncbi:MAG: ferredoxin [Bacteroidota bacterium]|nr:ferredoxin [Bacteroidota bacterium]
MIEITHYKKKCIGCNYCVEVAPEQWEIDEQDGKSNLKNSVNKKGVYTLKTEDFYFEENIEAADLCPVNIIKVKRLN